MTTEKKKGAFNPNLGGAFENNAFGKDSILLNITTENYDVIMKNLQVGSSILFRFNKVTTKGNKHYFTEILPPYQKKTGVTVSKSDASQLD